MYFNYEIKKLTNISEYGPFIKEHHYSKSVARGCSHIYGLYIEGLLKGVAMYGTPVGQRVVSKYGEGTIELKRLALHPDCLKNTASWFTSKTLKLLKLDNPEAQRVISYADMNVGHKGTIYKAMNFTYLGKSKPQQYAWFIGDKKKYHLRAVYQKSDLGLTKLAEMFKVYKATGDAGLSYSKPKHIFMYILR